MHAGSCIQTAGGGGWAETDGATQRAAVIGLPRVAGCNVTGWRTRLTHSTPGAFEPDERPGDASPWPDQDGLPVAGGWPDDPDEAATSTAAGTAAGTARWANGAWEPGGDDALVLAALLARVLLQDAAALSTMYQLLSGAVYAQLLRITRQVPLAEELLEDVFWQIWRQAPRFDARRGPVRAWVMVMARSRALDALRRQRRNPVVSMDEPPAWAQLDATPTGSDPQELLVIAQADAALHAALDGLDPLRRQLVSLTYFRGLTQQEVADHTGLPLGTVKSHLRRALAALRDTLSPARPAASAPEALTP
jgi:RNA polymerase sigma factor (sigma-70 family)